MWVGWLRYVKNEDGATTCMVIIYRIFKSVKHNNAGEIIQIQLTMFYGHSIWLSTGYNKV